jgi:hypothetical protein
MKKFIMVVEPTRTGYSAFSQPWGVITTGKDMPALRANIIEALNFAVEETGQTVTLADVDIKYYKPFMIRVAGKRI